MTKACALVLTVSALTAMALAPAPPARAQTAPAAQPAAAEVSRDKAPAVQALGRLLREYETFLRQGDPITAGMEGDSAAQALLPDISRRAELDRKRELQALIRQAEAISSDALHHEARLNLAYVLYLTRREVEHSDLDTSRLGFSSEGGAHQLLAYLASMTRITNQTDAENWLARLEATPAFMADNIDNTRRGLETGMVQAQSVVQSALGQARRDLEPSLDDDVLMRPFAQLPASIDPQTATVLRQRASDLVSGPITQSRRDWLALLETEYLSKAPVEPGLVHRPGGKALYAFLVRSHTTTDLTPDQVHAIGLEEVARIRARMEIEMRDAGWTGSFADFLALLRSDPQFYATSREQLLEKASEIAKRADDGLPALFGTLPRLPYGVRPVPQETEATYTTGRYNLGSMQNGVAGGYMVNTGQLDQRPLYELPALTLHEAVPGHHLQIALQQEAADQPYYRRGANVTAFIEGWGLYAEFLGEEMGIYRTPYERFGRLSYEMWRACRLVADTGLHWMGWTEDQARACFRDNSALSAHNIETELQRYISEPGQATAYKIGEIRLRDLRLEAEQALGSRFDVRTFHDALLVDGPLPLGLLDINMKVWLERQKVAQP